MFRLTEAIFSFIIILGLLPIKVQAQDTFEDGIVAVVNDDVITMKDFQDYANAVYSQLVNSKTSQDKINEIMTQMQRDGINRLIDDRLILSAAKEKDIQIQRSAVDDELNTIKARYPSEDAFVKSLIEQGLTISDLRDQIKDKIRSKFFVNHFIRSDVSVTPQEVTDYYRQHADKFQLPQRVAVDSIFIPFNDNKEFAMVQAKDAYAQLVSGADFENVAKKYSTSPSLGTVASGQLKPVLEAKIFSLDEGAVSEPFEYNDGVYIFKAKERFPQLTAPLEDVKDDISRYLTEEKFKTKLKEWLSEQRAKAYIELKPATLGGF